MPTKKSSDTPGSATPGKTKSVRSTKTKAAAAKPKAARKTVPAVTAAAATATAVAAAPVVQVTEPAVAAKSSRKMLVQLAFGLVVLLVVGEIFFILKGKVDRQGELRLIRTIGLRGGPPETAGQFWGPGNIRLDRTRNRVAMVDGNFGKILFWNTGDGSLIAEVDDKGKHQIATSGTVNAVASTFAPLNGTFDGPGNFYVLDRQHGEITVIGLDYKVKGKWKAPNPGEITADNEHVYIVDRTSNDIVSYTPEGKEVSRFGGDDIREPGFMASDEKGNIFIVDKASKKVVVFSSTGKLKRSWPVRFNPFGNPDIDATGGKVYLCEHGNQRVWVFTEAGEFLWDLTVSFPAVMGVDAAGLVYVSGGSGIDQYKIVKRRTE
jgi:hypothetical protein